ncbi:MAG: tRNA (N6-isopentenyl adenosine(37)-C2)-methylthiotransferase MiaB [Coriobacteriaceae bacterium]|jgi:tRNA-2-methylthio-N6-dimethylallyladenosine synthase|nr:tRNA (N6-isopentenyl adenosine(37)-C2)-methylthiotransferase MiaB [Coriobacteriaceae bacterium]
MSSLAHTRFSIRAFGCQMNKHDSERVSGMLEALGALPASSFPDADVVIFLTCCVREAADVRLMGQLASLKNLPLRKDSPLQKRVIAVGGCIGQRDGVSLTQAFKHLDVVFGTHNLASLPHLLQAAIEEGKSQVEVLAESDSFSTDLPIARKHSWAAWLPITVGCDNFCTYCIVPHVRGREKSRSFEDVVSEAQAYVTSGVKELTLLGQNVNSYGRDRYGRTRFGELLDAIDKTGIARLRFATSHPKDLSVEVINAFGGLPSLMPALHLPVQSGSDRILEAMNRSYTNEHYRRLVHKVRSVVPDIALSTDIIVGFPGETEQDFLETYDLVSQIGYSQVFTFIYSKREGTPAAKLSDTTPRETIQERFDRLVSLVQERAFEQNGKDKGELVEVLIEGGSKRDKGILVGRSPKNQTVHAPVPSGMDAAEIAGSFVDVMIEDTRTWYLSGRVTGIPRQESQMRSRRAVNGVSGFDGIQG